MIVSKQPLRQLSPIAQAKAKGQQPPTPPQRPDDRAEIGGSGRALTFAAVAGLCLMAGTSLVQAQVAPTPAPAEQAPTPAEQAQASAGQTQVSPDPAQQEVSDMDQLQAEAQKQGTQLQFRMRGEGGEARPISAWHAELILAEGGTVSVTESQTDAPDRIAYLTDARDLRDYLKYTRGDEPQNAQEAAANALKSYLKFVPTAEYLHPASQQSISPFAAAKLLAQENPVVVRVDGLETRLDNLREASQWGNTDPGCDLTHTYEHHSGVYCLFGP